MLIETLIGEQNTFGAAQAKLRAGQQGDVIASDLHGRFFEQNYRGRLYTFGINNTALAAANAIATGLTASAQPIIGVWNPATSGINLEILQLVLSSTTVANTAVSPGGFCWVYSTGNSAITTGSAPVNCKNLTAQGSVAKAFAVSTALTGLSTSLAVLRAANITTINAAGPATAIHQPQGSIMEAVDGSLIVPPGGFVGIMCAAATTTVSVSAGLTWAEHWI